MCTAVEDEGRDQAGLVLNLRAYGVTDSVRGFYPRGPGSIPGRPTTQERKMSRESGRPLSG